MKHMTEQEIRITDFKQLVKIQELARELKNAKLFKEVAIDLCVDLCNAYTGTFKNA